MLLSTVSERLERIKIQEEAFFKPDWLGIEVTGEKRYYNAMLLKNHYKVG